ncbi:MAG: chromate efflux transporter [Rhodospirillales bacterium]
MTSPRAADSPPLAAVDAECRPEPAPSLAEASRVWLKIGCIGFGGPAGQIALMHRIVVDEQRWIDEARFLHALNFCMLLPGPEAQQLATYVGWLLHRWKGGLIAGTLFVLPGAAVMMLLSVLFVLYRQLPLIDGIFYGIRCAVVALVVEALIRIGRRALVRPLHRAIAVLSFLGIFALAVPFPLIILAAGLIGAAAARYEAADAPRPTGVASPPVDPVVTSFARPLPILFVGLVVWFAPTLVFVIRLGWDSSFSQVGLLFAKLAVVTFGGAYAVLAYVAEQAVNVYGWLQPGEMLTGLGLAETTPGPLILVVQFVAFLATYRHPGPFEPMVAGIVGGLLATWVTFVPCFIWIFLGAPYLERLRRVRPLSAALAAITAAVVGVIFNLALWFGLHVVFGHMDERWLGPVRVYVPDLSSLDPAALILTLAALLVVLRFRAGLAATLIGTAAAGIAARFLFS